MPSIILTTKSRTRSLNRDDSNLTGRAFHQESSHA
ncbi:unnamed protein product [Gulo gulo]|uniref:Uncharacterized protein n=1 Tax=Gulo gulo TaxID=48420 RepID=A0A9X9LQZ5_GULGU|nr:unnamed protein product [Gulo gulo]